MLRMLAGCVFVLVLLASCSRPARPTQPVHSRASLVLDTLEVQPGAKADVGIQLVTDEGWHIYWQNPGDSGEPPRIVWRLPAGITAVALEWPAPERMDTTAGTDYGYHGATVLLSTLQIPASVPLGSRLELGGELRWLACQEICVPQRAQLSVPVRIATATLLDNAAHVMLQSAAERIPKPLPAGFHPTAGSLSDSFQLELVSPLPVTQIQFFPSEPEQIENAAPQQWERRAGIIRLNLKKSERLQHNPERLRGVIVLNGRDAYQIDVPVQGSGTARKGR